SSCSRPRRRCWSCNWSGHRKEDCTTKQSDFVPWFARCDGFGHKEDTCPSEATVLVVEPPVSEEDLAVEAQAFAATETATAPYRRRVGV
ncbi:unnamed protein product, partial [Pylaiella littoralis]